jgi:hypothetical protein
MPIFIPPISPQSSSPIIRGWYNRPVVAAVPKFHTTNKKEDMKKENKERKKRKDRRNEMK